MAKREGYLEGQIDMLLPYIKSMPAKMSTISRTKPSRYNYIQEQENIIKLS